ncbi:MAG: hypothetical protein NT010_16950 [Proteobacteria bacterium]|nr:hypothetical protein [Pseudomonadota bacterium]
MRKNFLVFFLVLVFVAVGAVITNTAFAAPAVSFTSTANYISNITKLVGWQFTVNNNITVNKLGFYDDLANGISSSYDVGIYDVSTQTLVVSGIVTPSDPYNNWFKWTSITPTVLMAGQTYDIVAIVGDEYRTWDPSGFTVNPDITYIKNVWSNYVYSLAFPK